MADEEKLRMLVRAAQQREMDLHRSDVEQLRVALERVLSPTLRDALGLQYRWDGATSRATATFNTSAGSWLIWHEDMGALRFQRANAADGPQDITSDDDLLLAVGRYA